MIKSTSFYFNYFVNDHLINVLDAVQTADIASLALVGKNFANFILGSEGNTFWKKRFSNITKYIELSSEGPLIRSLVEHAKQYVESAHLLLGRILPNTNSKIHTVFDEKRLLQEIIRQTSSKQHMKTSFEKRLDSLVARPHALREIISDFGHNLPASVLRFIQTLEKSDDLSRHILSVNPTLLMYAKRSLLENIDFLVSLMKEKRQEIANLISKRLFYLGDDTWKRVIEKEPSLLDLAPGNS